MAPFPRPYSGVFLSLLKLEHLTRSPLIDCPSGACVWHQTVSCAPRGAHIPTRISIKTRQPQKSGQTSPLTPIQTLCVSRNRRHRSTAPAPFVPYETLALGSVALCMALTAVPNSTCGALEKLLNQRIDHPNMVRLLGLVHHVQRAATGW